MAFFTCNSSSYCELPITHPSHLRSPFLGSSLLLPPQSALQPQLAHLLSLHRFRSSHLSLHQQQQQQNQKQMNQRQRKQQLQYPRPQTIPIAAIAGADTAAEAPPTKPLEEGQGLQLNVADYEALPPIHVAKRVVLVRHGQSTWNAEGRIQGSSDFAVLTPKGEVQAETSRQMLLSDSFDVCYHSPLARAKRTADIIWGSRKKPTIPLHDLREIDLYSFQGLLKNEGKQLYGEAFRKWQIDAVNFLIDGHYPVRELWSRAQKCWGEILSYDGQSVLVVAHNAVNQALVATATGLGPEYFRQLLQSNCGVSVLDFTPRTSGDVPPFVCLDRLNQTPSPPVGGGQSAGRKSRNRVILVGHGATDSSVEKRFAASENEMMNMLGVIQSRKTAELLLDVMVGSLICSPQPSAVNTAAAIAEVQEAADCLGADCVPRYVEVKQMLELRDMQWGKWKAIGNSKLVVGH